ncbi:uncharacterized protein METZ01_LOCUS53709 [marine metagenome]|uniref:Uncharacterized protein n=1 Tax=marine metagenome TaxID=408172 RepID=A0A381S9S6_9ZZZZ
MNPRPSPWQGDALPLSHFRPPSNQVGAYQLILPRGCAEGQNRTGDTSIFSAVLYLLSYLGLVRKYDVFYQIKHIRTWVKL